MKKKVLITGVSGLLGNNLAYCFKDRYEIVGVYHRHPVTLEGIQTRAADLTISEEAAALLRDVRPDVLIHCAAQANVDACEENPEEAWRINGLATRYLCQAAEGLSTKLVYISTDLVYDGEKGGFSEDDPPNPVNVYGQTKLRAEAEALKRPGTLVLRTNFFGWNVQEKWSLGEWAVHCLSAGKPIKGFCDSIFSAIYIFELAKILEKAFLKDLAGVYNCGSRTSLSKYDFLRTIAGKLGLDEGLIERISVHDFGFKARRARNLSLNVAKLSRAVGMRMPSLEESIDLFVQDLRKGLPEAVKLSAGPTRPVYPRNLDVLPYGRQYIDEDDIQTVVQILQSPGITQGPRVKAFEERLREATDAAHVVAVNSGTAALHIACRAAGVQPGDEVIVPPNTFVATANSAVYCGARPVFADIDPLTYNISPEAIAENITPRTKAVIAVHFAGQSCDMRAIQGVVWDKERQYGHKIYLIEDACHALGSVYRQTKVGSCAYSDMAVFSFHPVKHITTGEGGAVATQDADLAVALRLLRSHGITSREEALVEKERANDPDGLRRPWYYEQQRLGYNYRITDIQCALGTAQLDKLALFRRRRRWLVDRYNKRLKGLPHLTIPLEAEGNDTNFHLYVLLLDFAALGRSRARVMTDLKAKGVRTQVHYIPVYTHPFYQRRFKTAWGLCPVMERYYQRCLSFPLFPAMTVTDQDRVITALTDLLGGGS